MNALTVLVLTGALASIESDLDLAHELVRTELAPSPVGIIILSSRGRFNGLRKAERQAAPTRAALPQKRRAPLLQVPLTELRFRCSQCHTDRTNFVVT